jgi:hypothetical protein
MKELYSIALVLLLGLRIGNSQTVLNFSVVQNPVLTANAGTDQTIGKGEGVQLGASNVAGGGSGTYTYSWMPTTGLNNATAARPTATPDATTTYTVTVSDNAGCSKTSTIQITVNLVTGIQDEIVSHGFLISPNPTTGDVFLTSDGEFVGKLTIQIFSPIGQLISTEDINGTGEKISLRLSPNSLVSGVYTVRLSGQNIHSVHKIILQ